MSYGLDKERTNLEVDLVYATRKEMTEKEKRAANLMIYGLPHNTDTQADQQNLRSLLSIIKVDPSAVKNTIRLRNGDISKPPPFLVELTNPGERKKALENARELKNRNDYANVSISPDMTVAERLVRKKLLEKCRSMNNSLPGDTDFKYRIRKNFITMVNTTTNKIIKPNESSRSPVSQ